MARVTRKDIYRMDSNRDGKVTEDEIKQFYSKNKTRFDGKKIEFGGKTYESWIKFLEAHKKDITDSAWNVKPHDANAKNVNKALAQIRNDYSKVLSLKEQVAQLQQQIKKGSTPELQKQLKTMQAQLAAFQARLGAKLLKAKSLAKAAGMSEDLRGEWFKEAGLKQPSKSFGNLNIPLKGAVASKGLGGNMNLGKAISDASSFSPPASWGSQFGPKSADFNLSSIMQDLNLEALDNVFKTQQDGDKLMRLFYYYARMAASGDMGAMYEFMKFITYIISKDKAKQQVEMGKKLIKLQSDARKWTSELLAMDSSKSGDEFSKKMMEVKSETDSIATSQKLIAQMMEEMAQVVETLTNSTKAALDAHGRILRVVSRMG
ncbi:MAG: hypothetical protein ABIE74_00815 [Pseudomonadota bacterium]